MDASRTNRISSTNPTPEQERILQLLSAFSYLTTRQVDEYLGSTTTKRATERKLRRLASRGLVGVRPLDPGKGAASERCWFILDKGAEVGGGGGGHEGNLEDEGLRLEAHRRIERKAPYLTSVLTAEQAVVVRLL